MKPGNLILVKVSTLLSVVAIAMLFATSTTLAAPQDDDPVLQYGPDPNLFNMETIEHSVQMWKWQVKLSERQQKLISETGRKWEQVLRENSAERDAVQQQLASVGLMLPLDSSSIQKLDDEIRNLEGEVIGLDAELKQQKSDSNSAQAELQYTRESRANQIELYAMKLKLLQDEYQQTKKLIEKNLVSKSELDAMQLKIAEAETELKNSQRQLQLIETQLNDHVTAQVAVLAERQMQVKQRIEILMQKRELVRDLQPLQKIEQLNIRADMARQMIEMAQIKQFELELENTRNVALIQLATEWIKNYSKDEDKKSDDD